LSILHVGHLENKTWIGQFFGLDGFGDFLLPIPEPFVELFFIESGLSDQVLEEFVVPLSLVEVEVVE